MKRAEKEQAVQELNQVFRQTRGLLLINFTGLNVPDATELRRKVAQARSQYRVVKNTLALRAAQDTSAEKIKQYFDGPTAIAYTASDPVALAKVLTDFAKDHPALTFKAGLLEGTPIGAEQVEDLARLASREELLSRLAFLLHAPLTRLLGALQGPARNLALVFKQVGEKKASFGGDN